MTTIFWKVEDHALIGSKLSKQEVQSIKTPIFKMYIKLHWMHVKIKTYTKHIFKLSISVLLKYLYQRTELTEHIYIKI